jgi:hypothetical protein
MKSVCPLAHTSAKIAKPVNTGLLRAAGTLFIVFLALLLFSAISPLKAHAGQVTVDWNAPTTYTDGSTITNLGGYKIYMGTASGDYSRNFDVGNTTSYTMSSLNDGTTYYFAVMAYDTSGGVSGFSNEISHTTPALPPPSAVYTITAAAGSGGKITPEGSVAVSKGLSQTYTITPNSGYQISSVAVDGISVGSVSTYTFSNVAANHSIAVSFKTAVSTTSYSISAKAYANGSISPSGTTTVNSGGSKTFTITPKNGYRISSLAVDGVSVARVSTYTFSNVAANHSIAVSFKKY